MLAIRCVGEQEESVAATAALQRRMSMLKEELGVQLGGRSDVEAQLLRLEGVVSHLLREKEVSPAKEKHKVLTPIPALNQEEVAGGETGARLREGDWGSSGGGSVFEASNT